MWGPQGFKMVGPLVKLAEVRGAELDRKSGKGMRELEEKRRGTSEHLYLPQHRAAAPPTPCRTRRAVRWLRGPARPHGVIHRYSLLPIFRGTIRTESDMSTHPARPMSYRAANSALKRLGEIAGYRYPIHYYCFRRWVANEANRKLNRECD